MEINGWLSNDARRVSVRFVTCSELATMSQSQVPEPNETLYIQNLNESVTVPGTYMQEGSEGIKTKKKQRFSRSQLPRVQTSNVARDSDEAVVRSPLFELWTSPVRRCTS